MSAQRKHRMVKDDAIELTILKSQDLESYSLKIFVDSLSFSKMHTFMEEAQLEKKCNG